MLELGTEVDLSDNRPAVTMFFSFSGIDFASPEAPGALDRYVRYAQTVLDEHGGTLLSVDFGDKGAYAEAVFGVPRVHSDDPVRALAAAEALRRPSIDLPVTEVRIGLTAGQIWSGVIGGPQRSTYAAVGDSVNVSARLMQLAEPGEVLLVGDFSTAEGRFELWPLPRKVIKGHPGVVAAELVGPELESGARLRPRLIRFPWSAEKLSSLWPGRCSTPLSRATVGSSTSQAAQGSASRASATRSSRQAFRSASRSRIGGALVRDDHRLSGLATNTADAARRPARGGR